MSFEYEKEHLKQPISFCGGKEDISSKIIKKLANRVFSNIKSTFLFVCFLFFKRIVVSCGLKL